MKKPLERRLKGGRKYHPLSWPGEYRDEGVEMALAHQRDELIEALEMGGADPFGIGLEKGPDEQDAQVVGAKCGNGIEVAANGVGIPVVPAEPPVVRRGVIDAEAMAGEVETCCGRRLRAGKCAAD